MNKILFEQVDVTLIDRDGHHHMANSFLLQLVFPVFRSIAASRHHKIKVVVVDASPQVVDLLVDWTCGLDRSRTLSIYSLSINTVPNSKVDIKYSKRGGKGEPRMREQPIHLCVIIE